MQSPRLIVCGVVLSALLVACTTGTTGAVGDGGTSDGGSSGSSGSNPVATPRVTFDSTIAPGTHTVKECPKTGTWVTIGSFGNPALGRVDPSDPESPLKDPVRPVDDGGDDQGGKVSVSCSVKQTSDAFVVSATAQLTGANGGAVTMTGSIRPTGESRVTLAMTKQGETFSATDCVARFDTAVGHAIASGRLWIQVDCASAEQPSASQICSTAAQLRFENCAQ